MIKILDKDFRIEVWHTIRSNKRRSIATAFGVFWGILMLVVLLSFSQGIKNSLKQLVSGANVRTVALFTNRTSKPYAGLKSGRMWEMKYKDVDILRAAVPEIETILAPVQSRQWREKVSYGDRSDNYTIVGGSSDFFRVSPFKLLAGRLLNDSDNEQMRKYALIGEKVAKKLFGTADMALGKTIRVGNRYYIVVGVCTSISEITIMGRPENSVYIPETILKQLNGNGDSAEAILFTVKPGYDMKQVRQKAAAIIKEKHQVAPNDKAALKELDLSELIGVFEGILNGISALVWLVGIGTLLSGIVGVTNILLVTVRERTREIGVRRALGAKPRDIITQLLSESVALTSVAGIVGMIMGVLIMGLVGSVTAQMDGVKDILVNPTLPFGIALLALSIIIGSGLLGGLLPAYRAIQIKAIDAIRDE